MTTDPIERGAVYCEAWAETAADPDTSSARRTQPHYQEPRPDWLLEAEDEHRRATAEHRYLSTPASTRRWSLDAAVWLGSAFVAAAAAGAIVAILGGGV